MIQETISRIAEIEKEADIIIQTALEDAKQTVSHADEEAQNIRGTIREKVKTERKDVIAQANKDADLKYEEILKEGKQACKKLEKETKKIPAIEFISKKIYSKYIK